MSDHQEVQHLGPGEFAKRFPHLAHVRFRKPRKLWPQWFWRWRFRRMIYKVEIRKAKARARAIIALQQLPFPNQAASQKAFDAALYPAP